MRLPLRLLVALNCLLGLLRLDVAANAASLELRKEDDIILYSDPRFYSAFPSIVRRPNGELLVAFRRAPDRRVFGETQITHTDANAQLVSIRSSDDGRTWTAQPQLVYAHPLGGSQDPCMVQLRDSSILCSSYAWAWVRPETLGKKKQLSRSGDFAFLGGFILRSTNGGADWNGPVIPPPCPGESVRNLYDEIVPAYNRGAMCEGNDGKLFWVSAASASKAGATETHLLVSTDKGMTWQYSCPVARDEKISFNETSLYQTPKGDLVAFIRTENFDDHTVVARSTDNGKTFQPWIDAGFRGHPHYAMRLPDDRVLLVYGYRHAPYGIRARVLDPECSRFDTREIILRDDGGNGDLGYPWAAMISKDRALVVYYFNKEDGIRHIAGTFLALEGNKGLP